MNIGFFQPRDWFPPRAGSSIHGYHVASQLIRHGHTVMAPAERCSDPRAISFERSQRLRFLRDLDLLYIRPHANGGPQRATLLKLLKRRRPPVVWEINAPLEEQLLRGKSPREVAALLRRYRFYARFVDACICNTEPLEAYARDTLGVKRTFVVPLGSDARRFSPENRTPGLFPGTEHAMTVLWAGTAQYAWHGLERIFEISRRVYTVDPEIVFVFIGPQKHLARHAEGVPNALVLDEKPYFEMPPYIASVDAGICLYRQEEMKTGFYRSPLKVFDYMASGLPVIAPRLGQIEEIVRDRQNGLLVDDEIEAYVAAVLFLKRNRDLARTFGARARRDVERYYNWDRVGDDTVGILRSLF